MAAVDTPITTAETFQRGSGYRRTFMDMIRSRKREDKENTGNSQDNHQANMRKNKRITENWSNLTKEDRCLEELKTRVADIKKPHHDDHYLHKWLKARNYDVNKAETMYRESMAYREKMKVDKILETYTPPKVLQDYLAGGVCGFDKEGSPVRVELFGHLDLKGIICSARKIDLEKTKLLQCETTVQDWKKQSEKLGKRVDGLTVIFDMENVGAKALWRPGLQVYLHLVKILEDNYPEMMKRMFVINAPRIFPLLWKICRPLISEDMKNKIHVLDGSYKKVLLEYIDAEELPKFLGGEKVDMDGNPRCPSLICPGGVVPRSSYLSEIADMDNMDTASVPKGDKLTVDIQVDVPGSVLRWEFMTEDYDISFGVFYKENNKSVEVVPPRRINCHMIPEEGHVICQHPGTYFLVFDNSFSWIRAKKIRFNVIVDDVENLSACYKEK